MNTSANSNRPSMFNSESSSPDTAYPGVEHDGNKTLVDLLYNGFYLLFALRNGQLPQDAAAFANAVERYLDEFERSAKKLGKSTEDIYAAKYAFCAAVDETVLAEAADIRDEWGRRPLQLELFGDQLAGEHFFDRLEELRAQGRSRIEALEVFYMCLLLGFKGKFALEGSEKLGYLTARLGDEIANMKGRRAGFAPHWEPPDSVAHTLKREVPAWVVASVCALVGAVALVGLNASLSNSSEHRLAQYNDVVQLPPSAAHLTITLP
ncbi:type IV / VI secretion system protein, DotU family [Salinisphaera sp. C84B14]|uniref:type IVB secretion system protein IcmH/DotU n=1 Tax=Salinisphaera sp. C84B14 TaxID=1304155 RepID=UPI0032B252CF